MATKFGRDSQVRGSGVFDTNDFQGDTGKRRILIREERQFTNPHVRFITIRGRIVPILNKKRIGETFTKTGNTLATVGLGLLAFGGAKASVAKKIKSKITANARLKKIFDSSLNAAKANRSMFTNSAFNSGLRKVTKIQKVVRVATFPLRGAIKRPLIAGAIIAGVGVAARSIGFELERRSPFGADLFK